MRMRYAVSSMVFWWRENNLSLEQECEFLRSLGFGIELWPYIRGQQECRCERNNWPRLVEATEGMLVSLRSRDHGPSIEQWEEQIECARLLNASIVTDLKSLGIRGVTEVNGSGFAADVVSMAESYKVKLCVETGSLPAVRQLGKKFDSLWYCLDTGYANLDMEFGFKRYVDELAERVVHLHLSDNYGLSDDHETPGLRGGIENRNWDYLLSALDKYDRDIIAVFEMCPSAPAVMIRQASEFLFNHLRWPGRPQKQAGYTNVIHNSV